MRGLAADWLRAKDRMQPDRTRWGVRERTCGGFGDCDGGFMLAKAIIRKTCIEPDIVVIDMPGFRAHKN